MDNYKSDSSRPSDSIETSQDTFYEGLWHRSGWNTLTPNADELARYEAIRKMIQGIRSQPDTASRVLSILDLGCGRGWLSRLLAEEGRVTAVDPVASVVKEAQELLPEIRFRTGSVDTLIADPDVDPFDFVVCSEVIEHVPREQQLMFLRRTRELLQPNGFLILTTPRGELWSDFRRYAGESLQPVEDWLTETGLSHLARKAGFSLICRDRAHFVRGLNWQSAVSIRLRKINSRALSAVVRPIADWFSREANIYQVALFRPSR